MSDVNIAQMFGKVVPLGEGTFTDMTGELWLLAEHVALMLQQVLAVAVGTLAQRALEDRAIYCGRHSGSTVKSCNRSKCWA